ncbi:phosphate acetyltransferase [Desulfosporosinus hippei]|uniref:Phosphate acetyltransferase n=1 Tax=Desulfosporosinus hippei DSM 8344 TaxID=1121419 RepID=A0A1G8K721_9FIRM|nr:phosphate acetyltransferase [Desulfosporosinus hippei]SDI39234.1 phosphate acetyltransferase [Desulfosporosinus hippei DSM 8344]
MFEPMIALLKRKQRKLVFTEGSDPRILEAASRLYKDGILVPVLLGNRSEVEAAAQDIGWPVEGSEIIDPSTYAGIDRMTAELFALRKGKVDEAACRALLAKANYFGIMLVKMGYADGLLGGATYSTADTVRPALQIIKTKPGNKLVSSCFVLHRSTPDGEETYLMADCAINVKPTEDELVEIAVETARTARCFAVDPKVAMLSYSTLGSGQGETVDIIRKAAEKLKAMSLDFPVDGELQFDAAFSPDVAKTKAFDSRVAGQANTFIFPDLNSGNISYKIAQRLGKFDAFGPILQGLNAPVNDLSRGCNAEEVYRMGIITAALK